MKIPRQCKAQNMYDWRAKSSELLLFEGQKCDKDDAVDVSYQLSSPHHCWVWYKVLNICVISFNLLSNLMK